MNKLRTLSGMNELENVKFIFFWDNLSMCFRKKVGKNQERVGTEKTTWVNLKQKCYKLCNRVSKQAFTWEKLSGTSTVKKQTGPWKDAILLFDRKEWQLMHQKKYKLFIINVINI